MTTKKVCSVEDCSKPYYAKGYCRMHYARQLRNGDIELRRPVRARSLTGTCSVDGCDKPYYAKGYCRSHYSRQRRESGIEQQLLANRSRRCSIEGCNNPHCAKGYCNMHYMRLLRNGTTEPRRNLPKPCSVEGCEKPYYAKGFCRSHYYYQRCYGDLFLSMHPAVAEQVSKAPSEIGA